MTAAERNLFHLRQTRAQKGSDLDKGAFNSFELGDDSYSREKYYTKSTNKHDHSVKIQIPFPKNVVAMMAQLKDDPRNPYRSLHDVVRNAVVHQMWYEAERMDDEALRQAVIEDVLACEQDRILQRVEANQKLVEDLRRVFEVAASVRDYKAMRDLIDMYDERLDELAQPYRGQVERIVERYRDEIR